MHVSDEHQNKYSGEGCVIIFFGVVNELGLYILDIKIPVLEYSGTAVYRAVLVLEYTAVHSAVKF